LGKPLIAHVLERVGGQVGRVAINANGDPARFAAFGVPVIGDAMPGFPGPLAGIVAAMEWAARCGEADVLTVPVDTPFLPLDLVGRLRATYDAAGRAPTCARSAGRIHPVIALWPVALSDIVMSALSGGAGKVENWIGAYADFEVDGFDPFANINTPEDLSRVGLGR
jgi:molybdopterin-guanine dinucleotide biosynthesis protein A